MNYKLIFLTLFLPLYTQAQGLLDAQRLSRTTTTGTARTIALGGAGSAMGSDFGTISMNPAGIALARQNELMITPTLRIGSTQTSLIDAVGKDNKSNFGISNFGLIVASKSGDDSKSSLRSWAFGIGFNQLDNYHRKINVSNYNSFNSYADHLAGMTQGSDISLLDTTSMSAFAYNSFLIDTVGSNTNWASTIYKGNMQQTYTRLETGRTNVWDIAFGFNVNDKIYLGADLGILDVKYSSDAIFLEEDSKNNYQNLASNFDTVPINSFLVEDKFVTTGAGFNGKFGMIYRVNDQFRMALAAQTPTILYLRDNYQSFMEFNLDQGFTPLSGSYETTENQFKYTLRTPYKVTLGLYYQFGKLGFITGDFEMTDYSTATLKDNSFGVDKYSFRTENAEIANNLNMAFNGRIGVELRKNDTYFRGGFAYFSPTLKPNAQQYANFSSYNSSNGNFSTLTFADTRKVFSTGIGFRPKKFYFDMALTYQMDGDKYLMYSLPNTFAGQGKGVSPVIINKRNLISAVFTVGLKF